MDKGKVIQALMGNPNRAALQPAPLSPVASALSAYDPSLREKTAAAIGNILPSWLAPDKYEAQNLGDKFANLADFTPYGVATSADDMRRAGASGDTAGMGLAALGMLPMVGAEARAAEKAGIRAFHGSPHSFDKFSLDKIGTGEGAQAYGHGLYFAENEDVAKAYRDNLSKQVSYQGAPVGTHPMDNAMEGAKHSIIGLVSSGVSPEDAIAQVSAKWRADALPYVEFGKQNPEHADLAAQHAKSFTDIADAAEMLNPADFVKNPGSMYEVNIAADPRDFLDYDAPLSQQPHIAEKLGLDPNSRNKQADALIEQIKSSMKADGRTSMNDAERALYGQVENLISANAVEKAGDIAPTDMAGIERFRQAGIPGIKYMDAGSRGAADGTRNYVVFDDALVNIVRKYGLAGAIGAGLISAEMGQQMQDQGLL